MIGIHDIDRAVGELLDEAQIGRERILADDKPGVVQSVVVRGSNPLGEVLRNGVRVALHSLTVVSDRLAAHLRVVKDADDEREGNQQDDKQPDEAPGDAVLA